LPVSKIKISGNASGTGVVTLTAPNTNTDRTITLPDAEGTLVANTATGVDVTGSVTCDGANVAGNSYVGGGNTFTDSTSGYFFGGNGSFTNGVYGVGTNNVAIAANGSERMRIDSAGNINFKGGNSYGTYIYAGGGDSSGNAGRIDTDSRYNYNALNFYRSGISQGWISVSSVGTSYGTASDYRLKENVLPMVGSIDRLKALKPSKFNFIREPLTTVDGFLAHEAQEVVPECATGTKDAMKDEEYEVTPAVMDGETVVTEAVMGTRSVPDYQGIDQSKLVPLLVASLQEAIARIEQLENA
jgi:hypothetical protein